MCFVGGVTSSFGVGVVFQAFVAYQLIKGRGAIQQLAGHQDEGCGNCVYFWCAGKQFLSPVDGQQSVPLRSSSQWHRLLQLGRTH